MTKFERLLEATPEEGPRPSVSDVSYTVLDAVLGEELTKTIWSAARHISTASRSPGADVRFVRLETPSKAWRSGKLPIWMKVRQRC